MNSRLLKYDEEPNKKGVCCISFAVAAVGAAVASATIGTIAAAVAAVGTDLSIVGVVTGNKAITEIGGVMGLAGGAVGLADGLIGGGTSVATEADAPYSAQSDTAMLTNAPPAPVASANTITSDSTAFNAAGDSQAANLGTTPYANNSVPQTTTDTPSIGSDGVSSANDIGASQSNLGANEPLSGYQAPPANGPAVGGNAGNQVDLSNSNLNTNGTPNAAMSGGTIKPPPDASPGALMTFWNGLDNATKAHVATIAGQGVASMVGGLFNGWTQSQKLALQQLQYSNALQAANNPTSVGASAPPPNPKPTPASAPPSGITGTGLLQNIQSSNT